MDVDFDNSFLRVNGKTMRKFVGRNVTLLGEVKNFTATSMDIAAPDGSIIKVEIPATPLGRSLSLATGELVEVDGISEGNTIRLTAVNILPMHLADKFSVEDYNKVCELINNVRSNPFTS